MRYYIMTLSSIIRSMPQGSARRNAILSYLKEHPEESICVNRRYCPQLHQDNDLTLLLKKGKLKRQRVQTWSMRCRYTYLMLS